MLKKFFPAFVWLAVFFGYSAPAEIPHASLGAALVGMSGGRPTGAKAYPGVVHVASVRKTKDPKMVSVEYCVGILIRSCLITSRHCLTKDALVETVFRGSETEEGVVDSQSIAPLAPRGNEAQEGTELVVAKVLGSVEGARAYEPTILAKKAAPIPVQKGDPQDGDLTQGKTGTVLSYSWPEEVRPAYDKFPQNLTEAQYKELKHRNPKKKILSEGTFTFLRGKEFDVGIPTEKKAAYSEQGDSGSPIFLMDEDGVERVHGFVASVNLMGRPRLTPVPVNYDELMNRLGKMGCADVKEKIKFEDLYGSKDPEVISLDEDGVRYLLSLTSDTEPAGTLAAFPIAKGKTKKEQIEYFRRRLWEAAEHDSKIREWLQKLKVEKPK